MLNQKQENRLLYLTAPSRSGSSLLITILNCLKYVIVVNEPLNSYRIAEKDIVDSVFSSILRDFKNGFVMQRLDREGKDVTDTFPNKNISWQKQRVDFYPNSVVGIKKSFPSLGNKDYHDIFINEWQSFVQWFTKNRNGKVLAIIRNPIYTIFSWKTTFEALRADTNRQCRAWNRIVSAIIEAGNKTYILRYEDLLTNVDEELKKLTNFLRIKPVKNKKLPKIRRSHNTLDFYIENRNLTAGNIEKDLMKIVDLCSPTASKLGYSLSEDVEKFSQENLTKTFPKR